MNKSYGYIQVLLALREEYLKNELELKKLKQCTTLDDDLVDDYYFSCHSYCNEQKIMLDRDLKKSKLKRFIESISGVVDLTTLDEVQKDAFGNYRIKKGMYKVPSVIDQECFNKQIDNILNSDFVKNAPNQSIPIINGYVNCLYGSISMNKDDYHNRCNYSSKNDKLFIRSSKKITDDTLSYLLNSQIYESLLNDWQREIVEKNSGQIGEIIYPDIPKSSHTLNLSIQKTDNKLLLRKI